MITSSTRHKLTVFELGSYFSHLFRSTLTFAEVWEPVWKILFAPRRRCNHTCWGEGWRALTQEFPWKDTLWIPPSPALPSVMSPAGCFRASSLARCTGPRGSARAVFTSTPTPTVLTTFHPSRDSTTEVCRGQAPSPALTISRGSQN